MKRPRDHVEWGDSKLTCRARRRIMSTLVITMTDIAADIAPVTPAVLHILFALIAGASHGYGIRQTIERLSAGRVKIGNATLYRSLQKMAVEGLVEEFSDPLAAIDERRREYRLTSLGLSIARSESRRLHRLVDRHPRQAGQARAARVAAPPHRFARATGLRRRPAT